MHSSTHLLPCPVLPSTAHQYAVYEVSWHAAVGNDLYELLLCKELQLHGATTKQSGAGLCGGVRQTDCQARAKRTPPLEKQAELGAVAYCYWCA